MADRWFLVPVDEGGDPDSNAHATPKYADADGVSGFAGAVHYFDPDEYPDLPWVGQPMYVVRLYAADDRALDEIERNPDVWPIRTQGRGRGPSPVATAGYFNAMFGRGRERTFDEWASDFFIMD